MTLHYGSAMEETTASHGSREVAGRKSLAFIVSHSSAGGAQEIWMNLARGFQERDFNVALIALYPYRETVRATASSLSWEYVVPVRPTSLREAFGLFRSLVATLSRRRPDMIFTAMPAANVLVPLAAWFGRVPTRVALSHHTPVGTYNRWLDRVDGLVGCSSKVSSVVSVSEAVAQSLDGKPRSYRAKRRTIHNALPPSVEHRLAELSSQQARERAAGRRVVATGRLAPQKNTRALVAAAQYMPDVTIAIVGNGPEEEALKALAAELGVSERVRFLGHHPREEALELLAAGDVFAQPSLFEGHSLALIEAAKLGLPLIVSDVQSQVEGVTAADGTVCGLVVAPHDPRALASAICRLLDDETEYRSWSTRARHLSSQHSFDAMLTRYEGLIA